MSADVKLRPVNYYPGWPWRRPRALIAVPAGLGEGRDREKACDRNSSTPVVVALEEAALLFSYSRKSGPRSKRSSSLGIDEVPAGLSAGARKEAVLKPPIFDRRWVHCRTNGGAHIRSNAPKDKDH